jgi:hypothetical protein
MRAGLVILGLGLVILWIVGLSEHATPWLDWLLLLGALLSFSTAGVTSLGRAAERRGFALAGPFTLSVGLLILWIIGLATGATAWLAWWTFAFAIGYGLLGAGIGSTAMERRRPISGPRAV